MNDNYMSDEQAKTVAGFIEALNIISEGKTDIHTTHCIESLYDVIVCTNGDIGRDSEEGKRLEALGWHWSEEYGGWGYFT